MSLSAGRTRAFEKKNRLRERGPGSAAARRPYGLKHDAVVNAQFRNSQPRSPMQ